MPETEKQASLDEIGSRLQKAKEGRIAKDHFEPEKKPDDTSGNRMGMKILADFVSSVLGGLGIGYLIDYWQGTAPLWMLIMLGLGFVAGFWSMFKTARGYGQAVGFDETEISAKSEKDLADHVNSDQS